MDIAGFIRLLDDAELGQDAVGVAEAIWLARHINGHSGDYSQAAPQDASSDENRTTSVREPGSDATGNSDGGPPGPPVEPDRTPLYLDNPVPGIGTEGVGYRRARMPASTALPGSLELLRALRPLKRRAPGRGEYILDEKATAEASAESRAVIPQLRPPEERFFSLTLVVDTGSGMALWNRLEAELMELFRRLGGFRDLQRWFLRAEQTGGRSVLKVSRTRCGSPPETGYDPGGRTALRETSELVDPSGRRVVLLLTDGTSEAWHSGGMADLLRQWGSRGPLAILQPLPQRLWAKTELDPVRGQVTAPHQAAPNSELDFSPYGRAARRAAPGIIPVPVLEIQEDWLLRWARFLTQGPGATLECAVARAGRASRGNPPPPDNPRERVRRFAEQASPEARALAAYLSASESLSLPLMRHLQQALLPRSRQSHLAEVLLGGLIFARSPGQPTDRADAWRFEFASGVREELLARLGRREARRVVLELSRHLDERIGRGPDEFIAALAGRDEAGEPGLAAASIPPASRPFAEVSARVIERVTGNFTARTPWTEPEDAELTRDKASALIVKFRHEGRVGDIDMAITLLRQALRGGHLADRAHCLRQLAEALRLRYTALGQPHDLDDAAEALREALGEEPTPESRAALGTVLGLRFARTGNRADADEAIAALLAALNDARPDTPQHARYAGDLGGFLLRRGGDGDVAASVHWLRVAAAAIPDDAGKSRALADLGAALLEDAADEDEDIGTLHAAVAALREAAALSPADRPERATRLTALGAALLALGERDDDVAAIQEAVESYREAAGSVSAPASSAAERLTGLGTGLWRLAERAADPVLFDEAARSLRAAVSETTLDDSDRPARLTSLAGLLLARFRLSGHPGDLTEAVYQLTEAVRATPEESGELAPRYAALGTANEQLADATGATAYLVAAERAYRSAGAAAGAPGDPELARSLARVLRRQGRPRAAEEVLAVHPGPPEDTT